MAGIDILQNEGIKTYASKRTQLIATQKGLPVPNIFYDEDGTTITIGSKKIVARYFGPVHSTDGSMVYLPDEKILFGGCGVKSLGATVGNIGDADLMQWSTSIEKLKAAYPDTKIVVPGHGKYGDTSLLTYTINLFAPFKNSFKGSRRVGFDDFPNGWCKILSMEKDTIIDGKYFLKNAEVVMKNDTVNFFMHSPLIEYDSVELTFRAAKGSCYIENTQATNFKGWFNFTDLMMEPWDDRKSITVLVGHFVDLNLK
jgi:glyoxylase-like metal-dependent hydrolase (beta-lactamase superfamily II)